MLSRRLSEALRPPAEADLLTGDMIERDGLDAAAAAVLIAVTDRTEPGVILTTRRENMRTHAGQVAFPGGRIDDGETPTAAALREAREEIGLDPQQVDPLIELEAYRTVTDFFVTPVLAVVPPDLPLYPHEQEVADVFEVPLAYVLDPANQLRRSALFQGRERHYYEIIWDEHRIWGATAAMIVNLSRRLRWS